jgi:uncharacterized membrane protein
MSNKKTPFFAILMIIFCTLLTSSGQYLIKIGTETLSLSLLSIVTNIPLIFGFFLYGLGGIVLVIALKYGELSVLYPFIALSFIWVAFISINFLNEFMSLFNWFGMVAIIGGVSLIGIGGSRE